MRFIFLQALDDLIENEMTEGINDIITTVL